MYDKGILTGVEASELNRLAENVGEMGDYRSAAKLATRIKNHYLQIAKDEGLNRSKHEEYLRYAESMNKYAHTMRHEAAVQKVRSKKSLLERLFSVVVAITIASFLGVLYFLSPNITGNVVGINNVYSNWIGGVLFIVGLVGVFIYFKFKSN